MKIIYNTYVVMESQEQCDRMKQLCIDNNLPIWVSKSAFKININDKKPIFCFQGEDFYIYDLYDYSRIDKEINYTQVTGQEFIKLLNQ